MYYVFIFQRWVGPAFLGHKHPFIFTRAVVGLHGSMTPLEYDPDLKVHYVFYECMHIIFEYIYNILINLSKFNMKVLYAISVDQNQPRTRSLIFSVIKIIKITA